MSETTTAAPTVWIVDDDASIRWVLERALEQAGYAFRSFERGDAVLEALRKGRAPDVLMTDIRMPGGGGIELLREIHEAYPRVAVIVMTAYSDLDNAVAAYQGGAFEYLPKPFDIDRAVDLLRRAVGSPSYSPDPGASQDRREYVPVGFGKNVPVFYDPERRPDQENKKETVAPARAIAGMLGSAPAMQQVFRAIGRLARSSMTVLITGESGTGKELVARALHKHSPRAQQPFVALNTSAFSAELLESELFGHEKGAFTGAGSQHRGRFEQADGGTLFLDEIGDMSAALQTRLLRVLAEGEFFRVGGQVPIRVDVRVIAATHQDLEARVAGGAFREDLLHRLNVIRIQVPPLRERREDIPELLRHYLGVAARELGVAPKNISAAAERLLMQNAWSGNVRQLVNVCRRLTVLAAGNEIGVTDVAPAVISNDAAGVVEGSDSVPAEAKDWKVLLARWAEQQLERGSQRLLDEALPDLERTLIRVALARTGGSRQEAAKLLGWGRNTLARKLQELKMED